MAYPATQLADILCFDGQRFVWWHAVPEEDWLPSDIWLNRQPNQLQLGRWLEASDTTLAQAELFRAVFLHANTQQADGLARAIQLMHWHRENKYCGRCSGTLQQTQQETALMCTRCQRVLYPRINPVVITAILRKQSDSKPPKILLAQHRRAGNTKSAFYSLVAGFVEVGETLEQAVAREVLEETGLVVSEIRYLTSQPWPFPSNLMIGFQAYYQSGDIQLQEDELSDAQFFSFDQLPIVPPTGTIARTIIDQLKAQFQ